MREGEQTKIDFVVRQAVITFSKKSLPAQKRPAAWGRRSGIVEK